MKRHYKKLIAIILIAFTFFAPKILSDDLGKDICYQWLRGSSPKWTGIAHVWHVVSWQVGQGSAASWLEKIARSYEKRNSGVYISVEGMTVEEYKKRISEGKMPDIISFGPGLIDNPVEMLEIVQMPDKIKSSAKQSSLYNGNAYAVPYMMGAYGLYINEELVQSAGIDYLDVSAGGIALNDFNELLALLKDNSKEGITPLVYSIKENTVSPVSLMYLYTGDGVDESGALFKNVAGSATEDKNAYSLFYTGKAGILLDTHRVAYDLTNETSEMAYSFAVTGISSYTDMVQYLGITKTENVNKKEVLQKYINYMLRDDIQETLSSIGVFSTASGLQALDEDPLLSSFEQAILTDAVVPNAFTWRQKQKELLEPVKLFLKGETEGINSILRVLGRFKVK